jgi:hypothetical protein
MRSAEEVINQAIRENRPPEYILYGMSIAFVITGISLIVWSMIHGFGWTAVAGAGLDGLAWPAFQQTKNLRQQNLMLRMLEIPLSKARTTDEAAKMLTEQFASLFKVQEKRNATQKRGTAK